MYQGLVTALVMVVLLASVARSAKEGSHIAWIALLGGPDLIVLKGGHVDLSTSLGFKLFENSYLFVCICQPVKKQGI